MELKANKLRRKSASRAAEVESDHRVQEGKRESRRSRKSLHISKQRHHGWSTSHFFRCAYNDGSCDERFAPMRYGVDRMYELKPVYIRGVASLTVTLNTRP